MYTPHATLYRFKEGISKSNQGGTGAVKGGFAMSRVLCNHATRQFVQGEHIRAKGGVKLQGIEFCMCCSAVSSGCAAVPQGHVRFQPVVTVLPLAMPAEKTNESGLDWCNIGQDPPLQTGLTSF